MLCKGISSFFALTGLSILRRLHIAIVGLVYFALASCGVYEERRHLSLIGKTMGDTVVQREGVSYNVEFIPLFSAPSSNPEVSTGELFVIADSGVPVIVIRRIDNTSLEANHYQEAVMIATKACLDNPRWKIGNNQAALAKYQPSFSPTAGALKGRGFLLNGQWYLYEACE